MKDEALEILERLYQENRIDYPAYTAIHEALTEIEPLRDRDDRLEELWEQFSDVPMNPESECIEERFMGWGAGVPREEIWHWFDQRHSKGVYFLLYGAEINEEKVKKVIQLADLCSECETADCCFNQKGFCRFALIHERKPTITEDGGCVDYEFHKGGYTE